MTTNDIDARDIHRHDQQTAEQNAILDQLVASIAANLADGIEPGELAVIAAKTFLGDPGRACTMAGFALVRLARVTADLKANEGSEDARLAIAEDERAKARTELAYALHALTTAETELEKVRDQLTAAQQNIRDRYEHIAKLELLVADLERQCNEQMHQLTAANHRADTAVS